MFFRYKLRSVCPNLNVIRILLVTHVANIGKYRRLVFPIILFSQKIVSLALTDVGVERVSYVLIKSCPQLMKNPGIPVLASLGLA